MAAEDIGEHHDGEPYPNEEKEKLQHGPKDVENGIAGC
jgi:hypothetical protein